MRLKKISNIFKQIKISQFSIRWEKCHLCGCQWQIKLYNDEMGVRCGRCFATPVAQMLGMVFKQYINSEYKNLYELSSRGSFVNFLKKQPVSLTLSEYFPEIKPGQSFNGIECQNVENLTYPAKQFDVVTSLEVFEHVEYDLQGFAEIFRVLKSGGMFIFTVPIDMKNKTIERTELKDGSRINILPPEYHSDNLRGDNQVFCYRNYGFNILNRLESVGFEDCKIIQSEEKDFFGYGRPVICAFKK